MKKHGPVVSPDPVKTSMRNEHTSFEDHWSPLLLQKKKSTASPLVTTSTTTLPTHST